MVRNLEFRAFDLIEKKMCGVSIINLEKGCFLIGNSPTPFEIIYDKTIVEGDSSGHFVYFKDLDLMQYTGVIDKYGFKIFVNDIIEYHGTEYIIGSDFILYDWNDQQGDHSKELGYNHGELINEINFKNLVIVGNQFEYIKK